MKKIFVLFIAAASLAFLSSSFFNGPANRGHDKTGSPLSSGECMNCHSSGAFSPNLMISMYDGDQEVTSYDPGKKYKLEYRIVNSGSPSSFGFQAVALTEEDKNAGSFEDVPEGFQDIVMDDVHYVEHSSPRPLSSFEVSWVAPAEGAEAVTFYGGGVAANGNSGTGGDGGSVESLTIQANTSNTSDDLLLDSKLFSLRGNMIQNSLRTTFHKENGTLALSVYDVAGKRLINSSTTISQGKQEIEVYTNDLPNGLYFLTGEWQGQRQTERFYKK